MLDHLNGAKVYFEDCDRFTVFEVLVNITRVDDCFAEEVQNESQFLNSWILMTKHMVKMIQFCVVLCIPKIVQNEFILEVL